VRALSISGVTVRAPRARALAGVAAVAAAAGVAAGYAARPDTERHAVAQRAPAPVYDGVVQGAPLQRVTCANWRRASASDRAEILSGLAGTVGGASTTGGYGTTLSTAAATQTFDVQCATRATRHFILYVIYARAAGFQASP
jgi:hypothetical protein